MFRNRRLQVVHWNDVNLRKGAFHVSKPYVSDLRAKYDAGKMFERLQCTRCETRFHFSPAPRMTRIPHCPACGVIVERVEAA